jgi:hypothetical protein
MKHNRSQWQTATAYNEQASVDRFKYKYGAFVTESREYCSYTSPSYSQRYTNSQSVVDDLSTIKSTPMVAVHLSQDAFDELLELEQELRKLGQELDLTRHVLTDRYKEDQARARNPALKMAYDQYKLMLALVQ